jgi:acyl carrier protein
LDKLLTINQVLKTKFDLSIGKGQDLFDVGGLDSLDFAELLSELEEVHNLEIPLDAIILDWTKLRTTEGMASVLTTVSNTK